MKKLSLLFVLFFICGNALFAINAIPHSVTMEQPNGNTLTVKIKGDERLHWYESLDGYTLLFNKTGYLSYARLDASGNLQASDFIATDVKDRSAETNSFLNTIDKKLFYSEAQRQVMSKVWEIEDEAALRNSNGVIGQYKTLCAFVQFPEKTMIKTMADFEGLMNQLGYTGNGTGSVRDYFKESSYNQFDLIITLCGIYTAPNNELYYAGSSGYSNCDVLARWAAQQVAAELDIIFSDYDSNSDGYVDGFHFIFAGRGQEAGGGYGTIWSHKSAFYPAVTKNGKTISIYSCSPELLYSQITTIGVICHEMTHAFGEMDFYDTNYEEDGQYEGTGAWDIMAGGSWNGTPGGNRPPHHNMYTKVKFGWVTPMVLNSPITITDMPNSAENPVAYRINTNTNNEYFLIENRKQIKFDTDVPGNGLIFYRVHAQIANYEMYNTINATHPQRMYPVCANATVAIPTSNSSSYGNINSAGCPFPGSSNKTSFTDDTTPSMKSWANANTNKPITEISRNSSTGTVSFNFMGGGALTPVTNITGVPTTATAGTPLTLSGSVVPSNATNQTIIWSIQDAGTTGATVSGNTFNATAAGTAVVRATIVNGTAVGTNYTKDFNIAVSIAFIPVTNITGVPTTATAGTPLTLSGTVVPSNATNKTITWSIQNAGTTGATVSGNTFNATAAGTAVVRATIVNGTAVGTNYTKDFNIAVSAAFVPVTNITGVPTTATTGTPLTLSGTVVPSNATNQTITWSIQNAGTTGATVSGNIFNATAAGTAVVRATIANGTAVGTNYTKDFNIAVSAAFVPVTNITGVPTTATTGTPLTLSGSVVPSNATNQTITWSIQNAGTTGATVSGDTFNATAAGTAVVRATIVNGTAVGTNYTKDFNITVTSNEDIAEVTESAKIKIYPNPTSGALRIESGALKMKNIQIYDMTGRLVMKVDNVDNNEVNIGLSDFADGVYFINIDGQTVKVAKR